MVRLFGDGRDEGEKKTGEGETRKYIKLKHSQIKCGGEFPHIERVRPTKLVLEIDIQNAVFEGSGGKYEMQRLLNKVAAQIECLDKYYDHKIMDVNGNSVGKWGLE